MSLRKEQRVEACGGVTALWFAADGWVPNNPHLPALCHAGAVDAGGDRAAAFEALFRRHRWQPQWRNGIYDFHHFHATAHEALGIAAGQARVVLGGPHGHAVALAGGDCLVLPAGTGHCLLEASADLLVVGAYPPGQDWDLRRDALTGAELQAMTQLPIPTHDPVTGAQGALPMLWTPAP